MNRTFPTLACLKASCDIDVSDLQTYRYVESSLSGGIRATRAFTVLLRYTYNYTYSQS